MKKILFLAVLFSTIFFLTSFSQDKSLKNWYFSSQEEIDQFPINYPTYTSLMGDVKIEGPDITNLDSLTQITEIEGELQIINCDTLISVTGLSNLQSIGGIYFHRNRRLKTIDCFSNITLIPGRLSLELNDSLTDLSSFQNITEVQNGFRFSSCILIENLDDFTKLTKVGTSLIITSNPALKNISGFNNTDSLFQTYIGSNSSLKSITGLQNLERTGNQFSIIGNDSLTELNFPNLRHSDDIKIESNDALQIIEFPSLQISNELYISDNKKLLNLNGFSNLDSVSTLVIDNNDILRSIDAISDINVTKGYFRIEWNDSLQHINGFNNVKSLSSISISENRNLTSITGFHNIDTVYNDLIFYKQLKLTVFDAFNHLQDIGGDLDLSFSMELRNCPNFNSLRKIGGNFTLLRFDALTDLTGFSLLGSIGGSALIKSNFGLTNLNGLQSLYVVKRDLVIENNDDLISLNGLENLHQVYFNFYIQDNDNLEYIESLNQLNLIGESFRIANLPSLKSINGFENLGNVGMFLTISNLPNLRSLNGLNALEEVGYGFFIVGCNRIKNLIGLETLRKVNSFFNVSYNDSLTDLQGIPSLREVGDLVISENKLLKSFNGISSLYLIESDLEIENNDNLEKLDGLDMLEDAGRFLVIKNNPLLYSIKGIDQAELGYRVNIENNPLLSICNVKSICDFVAKYNEDRFIVSGNKDGCNTYDEVSEACINGGFYASNVFSLYEESPHWSQLDVSFNLPNIASTKNLEYVAEYVLCGERYSRINFPESEKRAYVRSDHEKAFFRRTENCIEREYLLYDFSLNLDDTTWVGWGHHDSQAKDTAAFVVSKIEPFQQYGKNRKKLTLTYAEDDGAYAGKLHWVEGIGCLEHPFYPFAQMDDIFLHKYELLCYDSANVQYYQNPKYTTCSVNYIAVSDLESKGFSISPNPFNDNIRIYSEKEEIKDIQIYSSTGQLVPLNWYPEENTVLVELKGDHPNGLYVLRITTSNSQKNIKLLKISGFPY